MKPIRLLLMLIAFLGISASVALADTVPTDPTMVTSGCGRAGQPACDFYFINSPNFSQVVMLMLDQSGDTFNGDLVASFVNDSGVTLTSGFTVDFVVPAGLSFQGCDPATESTLFTCSGGGSPESPITGGGTASFSLTGASICSVNPGSDDFTTGPFGSTYQSDGDADDNFDSCQASFTIALKPVVVNGVPETLPQVLTGSISTPEPSSAVLLLFGLAAGLLARKSLRANPA